MAQLITEWSTPDPKLADMLRGISAMPEYSVERMAAEAALTGPTSPDSRSLTQRQRPRPA